MPAREDLAIEKQGQLEVGHHEMPAVRNRQEGDSRVLRHVGRASHVPGHPAQDIAGPLSFRPVLEGDDHAVAVPGQPPERRLGLGKARHRQLPAGGADAERWLLTRGQA